MNSGVTPSLRNALTLLLGIALSVTGVLIAAPANAENGVALPGIVAFGGPDYLGGGVGPSSMAITNTGTFAYVNDYGQNAVRKVDLATGAVTDINAGAKPSSLAIDPATNAFVIVANESTASYSRILLSNNSVTNHPLASGSDPYFVVIDAAGTYAYFAERSAKRIEKVRLSDNTVVGSLTLTSEPSALAITPDGASLYAASYAGGIVSKVSTSAMTLIDTFTVALFPVNIAATPDGSEILLTHATITRFTRINVGTGTVQQIAITASGRPLSLSVDPYSNFAYVGSYAQNPVKVNLRTGTATAFVPYTGSVSPELTAIAFPTSGVDVAKYAYVANFNGSKIAKISISPYAPTPVTGTRGNALVNLSWTEPTYPGADPITDYTIEYSTNNSTWIAFPHTASTATSLAVTGLTNGTPHYFRVAAVSAAGTGLYANLVGTLTPATVPGAPTSVSATPASGQLALNWIAPASNGGEAITDYLVETSTDNANWTAVSHTPTTATTIVVTGLTDGTPYYYRVAAINVVGTGAFGDGGPATPAVAATAPSAPTGVGAVPATGQLTINWTVPTSDGGSPLSDYLVEYSIDNTNWTVVAHTPSTATSLVATGLTDGTPYFLRVAAINAIGTSSYGIGGPATPAPVLTEPGAPTEIRGIPGNTQLAISWTAPASDGGSAITDYLVEISTDNTNWVVVPHTASTATSLIATGLINGTPYYIRAAAINAIGTSAYGTGGPSTPATTGGGGGGTPTSPEPDPAAVDSQLSADISPASAASTPPAVVITPSLASARVIYRQRSDARWEVVPRFREAARAIPKNALFTVVRSPIVGQSKNIPAAVSRTKALATAHSGMAHSFVLKGKLWRGRARIIVNW